MTEDEAKEAIEAVLVRIFFFFSFKDFLH